MIYGKEPLGLREYGNVFGYLIAVVSVVVGTVSKDMIVMVMVSFQINPRRLGFILRTICLLSSAEHMML